VGNRGFVRVLEKKQEFVTFYHNPLHYVMALALSVLASFPSLVNRRYEPGKDSTILNTLTTVSRVALRRRQPRSSLRH